MQRHQHWKKIVLVDESIHSDLCGERYVTKSFHVRQMNCDFKRKLFCPSFCQSNRVFFLKLKPVEVRNSYFVFPSSIIILEEKVVEIRCQMTGRRVSDNTIRSKCVEKKFKTFELCTTWADSTVTTLSDVTRSLTILELSN